MQNNFLRTVMAISLGAMPGAVGRYLITEFTKSTFGQDFSYYGTFFINVTGCFIIALFYSLNEQKLKNISPEVRLIIATGFCGAYTTFSTYGLETFTQIDKGNTTVALIYWLGSMIIGMIAIQLGVILGKINSKSIN
ncbi:fluoride efflux transporter CrcB [Calothrix sp. FACHB-1219]|uniref:fluoride efflux transporter CrcB n=1 Tax=unclassified Calothrix TaxID=2619626 RepID=UPI001689676F|nr:MULTISPECIES: fluoride efflux transporter CrcB [unclassified Calothrix]MBD2208072.1 fluoride efflux transporter CrcB [Calothrix sp. FACHB-168]MBD2217202.1 fluoride efflux transporter CrcB [Calothrix sp. FACHB-1219]